MELKQLVDESGWQSPVRPLEMGPECKQKHALANIFEETVTT
jgi:hypothetical protein